jgi:hypothetical protein
MQLLLIGGRAPGPDIIWPSEEDKLRFRQFCTNIFPHHKLTSWDSLVLQVLGASLVHRFTEVELFMEGARCPLHDKMVDVANFVAGDGEGFATLTRWSSVFCDQFADNLFHIPLSNVHGNPTVPLNVQAHIVYSSCDLVKVIAQGIQWGWGCGWGWGCNNNCSTPRSSSTSRLSRLCHLSALPPLVSNFIY